MTTMVSIRQVVCIAAVGSVVALFQSAPGRALTMDQAKEACRAKATPQVQTCVRGGGTL